MKKLIITLIIIGILIFCGISQIGLFSDIYGKDGVLVNGMSTFNKGNILQSFKHVEEGCGNGLCEINEFHYNCPQDC